MNILKKKIKTRAIPLVIYIVNRSSESKGFTLFYNGQKNVDGLSVKLDSDILTYEELLTTYAISPEVFEKFYVESNNANQVVSRIDVGQKTANNTYKIEPIHPMRDRFQFQEKIVLCDFKFKVDFNTKFKVTIAPETWVSYHFYPKDSYELVSRLEPIKKWFKNKIKAIKK